MKSLRRRWSVWMLAALSASTSFGGCGSDHPYKKPRHVVLIVVDTLRADHLSTYGYRRPTSPELDKLAQEGVVFEHAVSQGSFTTPSMVSMMTGAYLADELMDVPKDKTTLAQVFQKAGYATAAYINNDMLNADNGFQAGFDVFDYKDPPYGPIDKISAWIAANKGKQTFTYIHLNEAHDPYDPPSAFHHFAKENDALSNERLAWYRELNKRLGLTKFDESVRKIDEQIGGYDDDVRYSDDHIGKILAAIRANGEWEETAIAIAADHGEGLWTHEEFMSDSRLAAKKRGDPATLLNTLKMTHGSRVDLELVHVPLILVAPGMPKEVRVRPWVENLDIAVTLLELCDLPRPPNMQGTSLLPLWSQPEVIAHQKRGSFTHTRYVSSFIDQNGYQLIKPTDRGVCEFDLTPELYDLNKDPEARVNLAPSDVARVEGMSKDIEAHMHIGMLASSVITGKSDEDRQRLALLGYPDAGVVDQIDKEAAAESVDQLLADLTDPKNSNCLFRIRAAMALRPRTLTAEQMVRLKKLNDFEPSSAIRRICDDILAKK